MAKITKHGGATYDNPFRIRRAEIGPEPMAQFVGNHNVPEVTATAEDSSKAKAKTPNKGQAKKK